MSDTGALLRELQRTLQARYDVTVPYDVEQFVCHDEDWLTRMIGQQPTSEELLLVHEDGDNLDLSLIHI